MLRTLGPLPRERQWPVFPSLRRVVGMSRKTERDTMTSPQSSGQARSQALTVSRLRLDTGPIVHLLYDKPFPTLLCLHSSSVTSSLSPGGRPTFCIVSQSLLW